MKTAGVVFDFYDDPTGMLLKMAFPTPEDLPEIVKEAHLLTPQEREVLRDDAFALVMSNEGKVLRKFACVDPGNTLLSALYLMEARSTLPEELVKVAATRIQQACEEFGLNLPGIQKLSNVGMMSQTGNLGMFGEKEIQGFVGSRLARNRAARGITGKGWGYTEKAASAHKKDEGGRASGMSRTRDSMQQPLVGDEADWAARTNLISVRGGADSGRVIPTANQMKTASAPIDVSGMEAGIKFEKKAATNTVLGKYPLDSYADIRAAVDYWKQNWTEFDPVERHIFSVKTAAAADSIGLEVPENMRRYGSTAYSPDVGAHIANRKANVEKTAHAIYDALLEKQASIQPEVFADLLTKADIVTGLNWTWGGAVADPYYATFGGNTEKEKVAFSWTAASGESVNQEDLVNLAGNKDLMLGSFDKDLVTAFQKDPVTIFESLPDDTKRIIANLATGG